MDEKEKNQFIRFLAGEWKACVRELLAYQTAFQILKQGPLRDVGDTLLNETRRLPLVQQILEKRFEGFDEMLPPAVQDYSEKVKEMLEKWKPPEGWRN